MIRQRDLSTVAIGSLTGGACGYAMAITVYLLMGMTATLAILLAGCVFGLSLIVGIAAGLDYIEKKALPK